MSVNISSERASISDLRETLEELSESGLGADIDRNLSLIESMGRPDRFIHILAQILDDRYLIAEIAGRSYRHVNHFDKIVLVDSDNKLGYRLTLHLWAPPYTETELNDELIHDHRFSFWSTVLTGDLISENFERSNTGRVYRQYQYVPEKRTLSNFYEFVGESTLHQTKTSRKTVGDSYYLSYERIHRVLLPRTDMVCTLVLRGPRQRDHSNVFNTTYPQWNTRMTNVTLSDRELVTKLSKLGNAVAKRLDRRTRIGGD